jgi:hypothetical protein
LYTLFSIKVCSVCDADVARVAKKYIRPGEAQIVIVGDKQSVEAGLKELGIGSVEARGPFGEKL